MSIMDRDTTLDTILGKLEALERSNATLVQRNASPEREMATLRAERTVSPPQAPPTVARAVDTRTDGQALRGGVTSRRLWLKRAAGAAVASVAAGAMLQRDTDTAAAHHGATNTVSAGTVVAHYVYANGTGIHGESSTSGSSATYGNNTNTTGGYGVVGDAKGSVGVGVLGRSPANTGVQGEGATGVKGISYQPVMAAVRGEHMEADGFGVHGTASGSDAIGVLGECTFGRGVVGWAEVGVEGEGKHGVHGKSGTMGGNAVWGEATGTATGVKGQGKVGVHGTSGTAGGSAVWGQATGSAMGVKGQGTVGVHGLGAASGYGGVLQGGKAQLRIVPSGTAGKPTSGTHAKGELYMDSAATLWVCIAGSTATVPAGTWKKVTVS